MNKCKTCLNRPELLDVGDKMVCPGCSCNPHLSNLYKYDPCEHNWSIAADLTNRKCLNCGKIQIASWWSE